jgi:hypothetical protein
MLDASVDEVVPIKRKDLIIARERPGHPDSPSQLIKSRVECTVTNRLRKNRRAAADFLV